MENDKHTKFPTHFSSPELYVNREMSWLEFNARVADEATRPTTPTLEKSKFLAIFTSNMDEFFMVRVAGLKKMLLEDILNPESPDNMSAKDTLKLVRERVLELIDGAYKCYEKTLIPELASADIHIRRSKDLNELQTKTLQNFFRSDVFPVLTPLAVDPAHPFPFLSNLSLYIVVTFKGRAAATLPPIALVEVPSILPRLVAVPSSPGKHDFILLEELIADNLQELFPGFKIDKWFTVRVTRNLDFNLLENEVVDLLKSIQKEVISREHQEAVRLEVSADSPADLVSFLANTLRLADNDVYKIPGPLFLSGLKQLYDLPLEHLKDPPFNPRISTDLAGSDDIFALLSKKDLLVHHPYESFYAVIEFLNVAAEDPNVLAIKQTLYRTSGDSPIIDALIRAAENGKQVTAVVELKARFDEKNNITWARNLERAGVNVVFGFVGLKTHCKATLIVRKEKSTLMRYVHLSSGNYNSTTAKLYTDIGFFSKDPDLGNDVAALFNMLTGFNVLTGTKKPELSAAYPTLRKLHMAPLNMRSKFISLIEEEIAHHQKTGNGLIFAKMNALVDRGIIEKLYQAASAGVKIQLIVRGICCLRPGIAKISENIEVRSIIDRFLEHSRIYYFGSGGAGRMFLSSADWMPRNMDRRIEILFPIENESLKKRLLCEVLETYWADNTKARIMNSDGTYTRLTPKEGAAEVRAQMSLINFVRQSGIKSIPYEKAIRHNTKSKKGKRPVIKK